MVVACTTRCVLTVTVANQERSYLLELGQTSIGRSSKNKIQINHPEVSRFQAVILHTQEGRIKLIDGGEDQPASRNGTFVNKTQIKTCWLCSGDMLHFGTGEVVARFDKVNIELLPTESDAEIDDFIQDSEDQITDHPPVDIHSIHPHN